jgi:hypothetical protein
MKHFCLYLALSFTVVMLEGIQAQHGFSGYLEPVKPQSPAFGKDIVILDNNSQDQRDVAICGAFNGWLYSAYSFYYPVGGFMAVNILRSTDGGITWTVINRDDLPPNCGSPISISIAAGGNSLATLKLFVAWTVTDNALHYPAFGQIDRFNANGSWEAMLTYFLHVWDISLATDGSYPAANSNPFSLGVLYSTFHVSGSRDTVGFYSSADGGMTLTNRQVLATTSKRFPKVSLAYGRCPSYGSGRYFATWEEDQTYTSGIGNIYASHSEPGFNSAFTTPVYLNGFDPLSVNKTRRPLLSCQSGGSDNDSLNLTEVIMVEKQLSPATYDTRGFYNLQAATSNHFDEFSVTSPTNNKIQPNITFKPVNSTFMLTYYDSVANALPALAKDMNMADPGSWNFFDNAYNDSPDIIAPFPVVAYNPVMQDCAFSWVKEGTGGNGVDMFDEQSSTYTGTGTDQIYDHGILVYPNPATGRIMIMERGPAVNGTLSILDPDGREVFADHVVQMPFRADVSEFPAGLYLVRLIDNNGMRMGRFVKE